MYVLAQALKKCGLTHMFGLCGIPVTDLAYLCQEYGVRYFGFRFEQQAGMAAATYGYLTKKPGLLLTVSSLGFLNGLTATINATVNCYPMIQISGSSSREPVDMNQGAYEQLDQFAVAKPLVKAAFRCNDPKDLPSAVARAWRAAVSGRPGGVYLDVVESCLGQVIPHDAISDWFFEPVDPCPAMPPSAASVKRAMELLASAKRPAFLFGKGAAYAQIDDKIRELVEKTGIPYFPMSMAKGLLPDNHPLSALSCRSTIMEEADVVVLLGARLNWLLSRGYGKWSKTLKFIQLDIEPLEIDRNRQIAAPVVGDLDSSVTAMLEALPSYKLSMDPAWVKKLQDETREKNAKFSERLASHAHDTPMTHWTALGVIKPILAKHPDIVLINEGANTLDDTRDTIDQYKPRCRVDCATWAIMGMGMGSCVGAAVATGRSVVAIEGDSAFGFSGMDFATIARFKLPVTVIVFNNGGIYNGIGVNLSKDPSDDRDPAPTTLDINARYEKIGECFGAQSYYVQTPAELEKALTESIASKKPCFINVQLAADSGVESGHIGYLNPESLQHPLA
ncbi:MAG: oxalyl-CoA decarboxylase [Desulfovibrio sp.]|nr:oxalyl-CoA decarboxylase [Desulfovibrio sp.]